MRSIFELPANARDDHIHGDGPHIGLTRPGFDRQALNEIHDSLVRGGTAVEDAAVVHKIGGEYGELAVNRRLGKNTTKRLRRLGFAGIDGLLN